MAKISIPTRGNFYHGVFPGGNNGSASEVDLSQYECAVKKKAAWVELDHEWKVSPVFPTCEATWIHARGAVPYIRLNLRSTTDPFVAETKYTLKSIVDGCYRKELEAWAYAAKDEPPFICEWGSEANGMWKPWNAVHNGGPAGGPLFINAYKTIVDTIRGAGAEDITWVFHVNYEDKPREKWNRLECYDPGPEYTDWLGVSIYGAQTAEEEEVYDFPDTMQTIYDRLEKIRCKRPIVISEFGYCVDATGELHAANWADAALSTLLLGTRWPDVCGFSWWNERWSNPPSSAVEMRVQHNHLLTGQFMKRLEQYKDHVIVNPLR